MSILPMLFRALAQYEPTLVGTYPLGLQNEHSDFDVACSCSDLDAFDAMLVGFLRERGIDEQPVRMPFDPVASVTAFDAHGMAIEVFCQSIPVSEQNGFRHMIVEGRLLTVGGRALRDRVRSLKAQGHKTEPAFAMALGLEGDPYLALLALEERSTEMLRALIA